MPKFSKGHPKRGGRKPGGKNKVPRAVRESVLLALNSGDGAVKFFLRLKHGSAEDRRTFAQIAARLIPTEVSAVVTPSLSFDPQDLLEVGRRAAFLMQAARIAQARAPAVVDVLPMPQSSEEEAA